MEKFLVRAAKHILNNHGANLSAVTVLAPNHRSCIYFRQALRELSTETIWSPELNTLQDWVYAKSELALIEPLEQVMELYEVYRLNGGEETLDEFIPTAQVMLSDFNEVDLQLADARSFFYNLTQLQSLKVYEPGAEPNEYTVRYKKFWTMFRELYFGLRERLLKQQKGYSGMLYREVAERMESVSTDAAKIYFVGFSGLNKSDEHILQTLSKKGRAEIIWDYDRYYADDKSQEAGMFFRQYKNAFKVDEKLWKSDLIGSQPKNIYVIGVAKNIGQTKVVADILANKLHLDESSEKETALIVPDEKLLNPLLSSIPPNISSLNISMGYPLSEAPLSELLKSIFALHDNIERFRSTGNHIRYYYRDVFDLLHHAYSSYLIKDKKAISSFVSQIRRYNRMLVSQSELEKTFDKTGAGLLFWYSNDVHEYLDKLLALIQTLRAEFLKATRSGQKDMSVDIEVLFSIHNMMQNIRNILSENKTELTVASLRKMLLENIRATRLPFEGEPVQGLQIMGMQETRSLDFKNVIALSMNEGIFPSGKTQSTYIPYEIRKEFLTTHQERDSISAYLFYRLLQSAENIFLLYNTESDALGGGEKSRFILQLQHELKEVNAQAVLHDLVYSVDPPAALPDDEITIRKDEPLMKLLTKNLGGYGISPSAVNTYINCSLQYYLRYIARLREQDEIEESIEASTLGSAVHDVLEHLYQEVVGKELTADFIESVSGQNETIESLLRESFSERFDEESLKRGKNYLLYRVSLKLIREFLRQEKENLKQLDEAGSPLKLLMLEREMIHPLSVSGLEVNIRGKVDRVEACNGIISVVDYKTGSQKGSKISASDFELFPADPKYAKPMQLLMYAWLFWKSTGGGDIHLRSGIYWLRNISMGLDTLNIDKTDILGQETLLLFEETLTKVLSELLNPESPFTKTTDTERCKHCEFARICRRD